MSASPAGPTSSHSAILDSTLSEVFGFAELRAGQSTAIEAILAGQNVLAVMPTGAGKSLCYQLPALILGGLTVVVSPLVALMRDQVAALRLNGIPAATINSDLPRHENVATWRAVQTGEVALLYLSPERLMTEPMLRALAKLDIRLLAIDEAHCISQWGPAFRPEYAALSALRDRFPGVPIIGLTATADPSTRDDIRAWIFAGNAVSVVTGFDRPNLSLAVELKQRWKQQVSAFVRERPGASGIIYCLSRRKTEEVAAMLCTQGHNALAFHAGIDPAAKERIQNRFMTDSGIIIAATVAFGMGIDKPDIRYVLHTDLPGSPEAYYQEIGRAGRDGESAETMLLYGMDDIRMRRVFIEQEDSEPERKRRENRRLDALIAYCESPTCRRQMLLRYFGEESGVCGNCDTCRDPVQTVDGITEAGKVLSAIHSTGQRFGAAHIVQVLRGARNERTARYGHDDLADFGVGADRPRQEWQGIIRQMVAAGLLEVDISGYGGLRATAAGEALLRGEGSFRYRPDRLQQKQSPKTAEAARAAASELDESGTSLLESLKALRLQLAQERKVPAYVIFSDRTLVDMAAKRPSTADEFGQVFGVGAAKLAKFAEIFLDRITQHTRN